MEASVRLLTTSSTSLNRHLFIKTTSSTTTTTTAAAAAITTHLLNYPFQTKLLHQPITSSRFLSRIQSSTLPPSPHSFQNPIQFLLSLSTTTSNFSPNLSIPLPPTTNDANFTFSPAYNNHIVGDANAGGLGARSSSVTVVLLGWLGAKTKHLKRYVDWYNSRGINAITFVVDVRDVLWFDLGKRAEKRISELGNVIASWVLKKEEDGRERCLLFHTFSNTGWFVYGSIIDIFQGSQDLLEKIKGCVVDSGASGVYDNVKGLNFKD